MTEGPGCRIDPHIEGTVRYSYDTGGFIVNRDGVDTPMTDIKDYPKDERVSYAGAAGRAAFHAFLAQDPYPRKTQAKG